MSVSQTKTPKKNKKQLTKIKSMLIEDPKASHKMVPKASIIEKQIQE
jgi:hypothetical protein